MLTMSGSHADLIPCYLRDLLTPHLDRVVHVGTAVTSEFMQSTGMIDRAKSGIRAPGVRLGVYMQMRIEAMYIGGLRAAEQLSTLPAAKRPPFASHLSISALVFVLRDDTPSVPSLWRDQHTILQAQP